MYSLLIQQIINDKMYFSKNRRKLVVRDDIWSLMKNDRARQLFIEEIRTSRPNGFATITVAQRPMDILYSDVEAGRRLLSHMNSYILGKFNSHITQSIVKELSLNKYQENLLNQISLKKREPTESRSYLMIDNNETKVFSNKLTDMEMWIYSSSEDDRVVFDYYMKTKKLSLDVVLDKLSKKEHHGDKDLFEFLEKEGFGYIATQLAQKK